MGVIEDIKEIADFVKKHGNEALFRKTLALQEKIVKFNQEETQLKIQLKDARDKIEIKSKMIYQKPFLTLQASLQLQS